MTRVEGAGWEGRGALLARASGGGAHQRSRKARVTGVQEELGGTWSKIKLKLERRCENGVRERLIHLLKEARLVLRAMGSD